MPGGLIHLVYIGNQDKVLTALPTITFFKTAYCRYSTFAIQDHYIESETDTNFGCPTHYKLRPFGDLLFRPYLKVTLPTIVASYKVDISQHITAFNNETYISNTDTNIILSKLRALEHNYSINTYPVYINDTLSLMYNFEDCAYGTPKLDIIEDNDYKYLHPSTPVSSYEQTAIANRITTPSKINNRNIYYSPYNASYLTTVLNKISFDDDTIWTADDYFENFRATIFRYITVNHENKFIYTLLNNKQLYTYNLLQKNVTKTVTNEITYKLDYIYSNIKLLYVYQSSAQGKSLKSIFFIEDYIYSNFTYTNKLRPVENLYTYIEDYITPYTNTLFIADGYNTNKAFNIHEIAFMKYIEAKDSYLIVSGITKDPNKLYMIYPDQNSGTETENYYDLYFNKYSKDNKVYNIYNNHELLLPLCYLKFNTNTNLYQKMNFNPTITVDDFVYLYKDVIIFDSTTHHYNYALINNNMYEFTNDTEETQYTNNLYIKNKLPIVDATVTHENNTSFLLNSTNSLTFINNYTGNEYSAHDYIMPYSINIDVTETDFDNNRMAPILTVTNTILNLDTYEDTEFIKEQISELNLTKANKTSIIYSNVTGSMERNMLYIKNLFDSMFDENIYYKFYNSYTYIDTVNVNIPLKTAFKTNLYTNLISIVNGTQEYYNLLQNVIVADISLLIDNNETLHSKLIRDIINLDDPQNFISTLHQVKNNNMYLHVTGANESLTYYVDDSGIYKSKICFTVNNSFTGDDILTDLSDNFDYTLTMDGSYYTIPNMYYISNGSTTIDLVPYDGTANKEFYIFNTLYNLSNNGNPTTYMIEDFYIVPNNMDVSGVDISAYKFTTSRTTTLNVFTMFDNIQNNNLTHYIDTLFYNNTVASINIAIDVNYILYHYGTYLFQDIKDRMKNDYNDNHFTKYNDMRMYDTLRHVKQLLHKKTINGNQTRTIDLTSQTAIKYIDCNICYADHVDHIMINNSIKQNVFTYISTILKPLIIELLYDKKNYFNFFINEYSFTFSNDISDSLDIDLDHVNSIKLIQWYFHYLNSIKSDINGYVVNDSGLDILTNITIEQIITLCTFFSTSTNIFDPSYNGLTFDLSSTDYDNIVIVNQHVLDFINHIKSSTEKRKIYLDDGTIAIFADTNETQTFTMIYFNTMTLQDFIIDMTDLYISNFYKDYLYKDIIPFFYNIKKQFQDMYISVFTNISNMSSFSASYLTQIKQLLNFEMNDYVEQMDWFRTNVDYTLSTDIYKFMNETSAILEPETYYNMSLINSSEILGNYYSVTFQDNAQVSRVFSAHSYLLDIKFETVDNLINNFNNYFNYDYLFYSDYKIIYALYFFYYYTYQFTVNSQPYRMEFNNSDNTSTDNEVTNLITGDIYAYSYIVLAVDNKALFTVINNKLFDTSENVFVNYTHHFTHVNNVTDDEIRRYDDDYIYHIINNNIVDISENIIFVIKDENIYDLSNVLVGTHASDIYSINDIVYKYELTTTLVQALFANYVIIPITNHTIVIDDVTYDIIRNIFHDDDYNVIFKFAIPTTNVDTGFPAFQVIFEDTYIPLIPGKLRPLLGGADAMISLLSVFESSFTKVNMQKSVRYLRETVHNSIFDFTESNNETTFKDVNIGRLMRIMLQNSILPQQNYIDETIMCANFNNWKNNNHDIDDILLYLKTYNETSINIIKIFNETDQTIILLEQVSSIALLNKTYHFVVDRTSYIPLQVEGTVYRSSDDIINLHNTFASSLTFMLHQSKMIKLVDISSIILLQHKTELVKNKIIDEIFDHINISADKDFYTENVHFDISDDIVTWDICDNNINENSVFIRNSILIDNSENVNMLCIEDISNTLMYIDHLYYLKDICDNLHRISIINDISSDISYNDCIFLYDDTNVYIDVSSSIFPKTLSIFEGRLYRLNTVENGYTIDSCGNLIYDFQYDTTLDVLLKTINNYNKVIYDDLIIVDISVTVYDSLDDLSTNHLLNSNDLEIFTINNIDDTQNIYMVTTIDKQLENNYVLLDDKLGYISYSYTNVDDEVLMKIFMIDDFTFDPSDNYTIKYKTRDILTHIGTEKLWYKAIFYHWETFYKSLTDIRDIVATYDDTYFNKKKISRNSFIEEIFNTLTANHGTKLFSSCVDHFNRDTVNNINTFDKLSIVQTLQENIVVTFRQYNDTVKELKVILGRDTIPKCSWIDYIGNYICDSVDFQIDGNVVEEINDQIIHIYNCRDSNMGTEKGLYDMIGHNSVLQIPNNKIHKHVIYVPLPMCFQESCKALPIIALTNSALTMAINIKAFERLIIVKPGITVKPLKSVKVSINASYVFLDLEMRQKFARMRHEYLYEIKKCYKYTVSEMKDELKLEFSGPCKEMFWFYVSEELKNSNNIWNYTGVEHKLYNPDLPYDNDYSTDDDVRAFIIKMLTVKEKYYDLDLTSDKLIVTALSSYEVQQLSDYIKRRCSNPNPFTLTSLDYSGHNRFCMDGIQSTIVESIQMYKDTFMAGLNCKTWSRDPKGIAHMGYNNYTMNYDMRLKYEMSGNVDGTIYVVTNGYNLLRIASGIGCTMW